MKKTIKVCIFLILIVLCVCGMQLKFGYVDELDTQTVLGDFYQLEDNTVDVIALGTSAVQRGWVVPYAYKEYGIASYTLATASQPFCLTKYIIKEAEKTQKPKVYLIDIRSAIETPAEMEEGKIRRVTDTMKESPNRWDAVKAALKFASLSDKNSIDSKDISYFLKIAKYHTLFDPNNLPEKAGVKYFGGFAYYEPSMFNIVPMEDVGIVTETLPINRYAEKALNELLDYCDSLGAKVIFTRIPYAGSKEELAQINTAIEIVRGRGYECKDFLTQPLRDEIGVDFDTFFYNPRHTNFYGSTKYTAYMCEYLRNNCGVEDRRNDYRYSSWERASEELQTTIGSKFDDMLREINTYGYH